MTAGCAHGGRQGSPPARSGLPEGIRADELSSQRLYRVHYEGPGGDGGMRLVLHLAAADSFGLSAADSLGKPLWSLRLEGDEALMVDHRGRRYCTGGERIRIPETALAPLPLAALPRVLLGRLPADAAPGSATRDDDFRDREGRRWTATRKGGRLETWTLWENAQPLLWWRAWDRGGILSHRDGVQFRWRQVAAEPLAGERLDLEIPAGYAAGACDDWELSQFRQD